MPDRKLVSRILLGLLATWLLLALTAWHETSWRHSVDSAIYLLTAKSLSLGEGFQYLGRPFFVRPPGLSWLLAPMVDTPFAAGQVGDLNLFVQASYALAMLGVLLVLRRLHGALWGTAITLLAAVNPLVVDGFNEVLSEFPSMALLFFGLALLMPGRDGARAPLGRAVPGALLIGASLWFRSVGLLALPAIGLAELLRRGDPLPRRLGRGALLCGLVLACIAPWMLESGRRAEAAPRPSTQLLMFDYGTAMFRVNPSDPSSAQLGLDDWVARVSANASDISGSVARVALGSASGREGQPRHDVPDDRERVGIAPLLAGLAALVLLITALTRRHVVDFYALAYAALLLLYFTYVDRLLLPLVPLLLSALFHTLDLLGRRLGPRARQALPAGFAAALLLSSLLAFPEAVSASEKKQQNFRADRQVARWVDANLPADAELLYEKGSILSLLSGRRVFTYRNLPGPWPEGCPPVDWALFGPRHLDSATEASVAAAARESRPFKVKFFGRPALITVFGLDR